MVRILLFAMILVGCDMGPEETGLLSLDPNYGNAPAGVSIEDVDIIKDGTIDMEDLVAVAYYFGQDVVSEEAVAESCPAGQYRRPLRDVVGFNSYYRNIKIDPNTGKYIKDLPEQDRPPITHPVTGIRLEDKYKESCEYLYPNIAKQHWRGRTAGSPPPPDYPDSCLVPCATDAMDIYGRVIVNKDSLCRQDSKIIAYTACRYCPYPAGETAYVPIDFPDYIQSDDPTKCLSSPTRIPKPYRFPAPSEEGTEWLYDGEGGYYHYALIRVREYHVDPNRQHTYLGDPMVALRFLVVEADDAQQPFVNGEPIVRQIKAKFIDSDTPERYSSDSPEKEILWWASSCGSVDHLPPANGENSYGADAMSAKQISACAAGLSLENHNHGGNHTQIWVASDFMPTSELTTPVVSSEDFLQRSENAHLFPIIQQRSIQVGEPSGEQGLTDAVIYRFRFQSKNERYRYHWDMILSKGSYQRIYPSEVREKYFPEDVE